MASDHLPRLPDEERRRFKDQHTDERIHQHLNNLNDEITEDDIRNVRTDIGIDDIPVREPALPVENADADLIQKENMKDNTDPDVKTSWNMLES